LFSKNYDEFAVFDVSKDYGEMTFGVNLNDVSDDDFDGITVWRTLGDAVEEMKELVDRDRWRLGSLCSYAC